MKEATKNSASRISGSMVAVLDDQSDKQHTVALLYNGSKKSTKLRVPLKYAAVPQIYLPEEESVFLRPDMVSAAALIFNIKLRLLLRALCADIRDEGGLEWCLRSAQDI